MAKENFFAPGHTLPTDELLMPVYEFVELLDDRYGCDGLLLDSCQSSYAIPLAAGVLSEEEAGLGDTLLRLIAQEINDAVLVPDPPGIGKPPVRVKNTLTFNDILVIDEMAYGIGKNARSFLDTCEETIEALVQGINKKNEAHANLKKSIPAGSSPQSPSHGWKNTYVVYQRDQERQMRLFMPEDPSPQSRVVISVEHFIALLDDRYGCDGALVASCESDYTIPLRMGMISEEEAEGDNFLRLMAQEINNAISPITRSADGQSFTRKKKKVLDADDVLSIRRMAQDINRDAQAFISTCQEVIGAFEEEMERNIYMTNSKTHSNEMNI